MTARTLEESLLEYMESQSAWLAQDTVLKGVGRILDREKQQGLPDEHVVLIYNEGSAPVETFAQGSLLLRPIVDLRVRGKSYPATQRRAREMHDILNAISEQQLLWFRGESQEQEPDTQATLLRLMPIDDPSILEYDSHERPVFGSTYEGWVTPESDHTP